MLRRSCYHGWSAKTVARSIQDQMMKRGESHVLLDVSHESASKVCFDLMLWI